MTVSGVMLTPDEVILVRGLRSIKEQGSGDFLVKMESGRYTVFSCKPDFGRVNAVNEVMGMGKR